MIVNTVSDLWEIPSRGKAPTMGGYQAPAGEGADHIRRFLGGGRMSSRDSLDNRKKGT